MIKQAISGIKENKLYQLKKIKWIPQPALLITVTYGRMSLLGKSSDFRIKEMKKNG